MGKLIIIRGSSGAGKSTVAKELQRRSLNKIMVVSEDEIRDMFSDPSSEKGRLAYKKLIVQSAKYGLLNGYDVVVEGILHLKTSKKYIEELFKIGYEETHMFYFDVSFEETVSKHNTRVKKKEFGPDSMKKWWEFSKKAGAKAEYIIQESSSIEDSLKTISKIADLKIKDTEGSGN